MTSIGEASPNLLIFTAPFAPTAGSASIDGRIVNQNGRGLRNIRVTLQNGSTSEVKTALTNAFGYFRLEELEVGSFYVLSVQHKRYVFQTSSYAFTLNDDLVGFSFVGTQF